MFRFPFRRDDSSRRLLPTSSSTSDASMKRNGVVPTAPPPEAYYEAPPLPRHPPPRYRPTSPATSQPAPAWQRPTSPRSYPSPPPGWNIPGPALPPKAKAAPVPELRYEVIEEPRKTQLENVSRFNVKPGKPRRKFNPQLHTERYANVEIQLFGWPDFLKGAKTLS